MVLPLPRSNHPSPSLLGALALAAAAALALTACGTESAPPQREVPADVGPLATLVPTSTAPPARPARPASAGGGETWNAAEIEWLGYEAGLARAKAEKKPICLVFFTTWCPHCKNFSRVFEDPRVVAESKKLVMIRLDADQESDIAQRFARDGGYIPRTFFLAPDGTPDFDIHAPRDKYAYFYDERDPASILGGMAEALRKLAK